MGQIVEEVKLWNTPIVGAFLLWRFTNGYCDNHSSGDAPSALLHFVACAILTNNKFLESISNQRSDLQSYARSFEDNKNSDLLLSLQERVKAKREYTLRSIDIAVANGLLVWEAESGKIYPKKIIKSPNRRNALKVIYQKDGKKAEILGKWFSQNDLSTIAKYLKLVF
jgi:hypothetical protein